MEVKLRMVLRWLRWICFRIHFKDVLDDDLYGEIAKYEGGVRGDWVVEGFLWKFFGQLIEMFEDVSCFSFCCHNLHAQKEPSRLGMFWSYQGEVYDL